MVIEGQGCGGGGLTPDLSEGGDVQLVDDVDDDPLVDSVIGEGGEDLSDSNGVGADFDHL